jgi:hypothetical protein
MVGFAYQPRSGTAGKASQVGGKLFASLFFLVFFGMGSLFVVFIAAEFGRGLHQRTWRRIPCKIAVSEVHDRADGAKDYVFAVNYVYEYANRTYSGSVYQRQYKASSKYSQARNLSRKYPVGRAMFCYVNPKAPAEAVLKRDNLALILLIFIPLIFVVIGAGGLYFTWRPKRPEAEPKPQVMTSLAAKARVSAKGRYALAGFLGVFGVVGLGTLYSLGLQPLIETLDARTWVATPCRVLRAEVQSHDSDDGTTYSVYVLYEYEVDGKTYKSDTYTFVEGSSSGYDGKAKVVEQYRSAANPICYVNPKNPDEAVLKRGFHAGLLVALIPLTFMLIGFGGAYAAIRRPRRPGEADTAVLRLADGRPVALKPTCSPLAKLAGVMLIALFWDGLLSVFVREMISGFHHGHPQWFLVIFLVPFEIIGVVLLGMVVYYFLALLNPRLRLELGSPTISLGAAAELRWTMSGRVARIRELTVTLRGTEAVTYETKSGNETQTATAKNTFYEMELLRTFNPYDMAVGSVGFVIPRDTMYSFDAKHNKIVWSLDLHGQIAHWPDMKESFKLTVTPAVR